MVFEELLYSIIYQSYIIVDNSLITTTSSMNPDPEINYSTETDLKHMLFDQ